MISNSQQGLMFEGPPERRTRILIIEDNPGDVYLLRFALSDAHLDCEMTLIDDGADALAFARKEGEYQSSFTPDLVVLDLNLPKTDGLAILAAMNENRAFSDVPVAVLSSALSPQQLSRLEQFNVEYRCTKPSTLEELSRIGLNLKALIENGSDKVSAEALA